MSLIDNWNVAAEAHKHEHDIDGMPKSSVQSSDRLYGAMSDDEDHDAVPRNSATPPQCHLAEPTVPVPRSEKLLALPSRSEPPCSSWPSSITHIGEQLIPNEISSCGVVRVVVVTLFLRTIANERARRCARRGKTLSSI